MSDHKHCVVPVSILLLILCYWLPPNEGSGDQGFWDFWHCFDLKPYQISGVTYFSPFYHLTVFCTSMRPCSLVPPRHYQSATGHLSWVQSQVLSLADWLMAPALLLCRLIRAAAHCQYCQNTRHWGLLARSDGSVQMNLIVFNCADRILMISNCITDQL